MKKILANILIIPIFILFTVQYVCASPREIMELSGTWDFDQTNKAYPPKEYSRKIRVPGLIDLAVPRIDEYEELFLGDQQSRYSWYRYTFITPESSIGKKAILTILKSRFNTQVILNDIDLGTYIQTSTPIECDLTNYLNHNKENTLLIRVDDMKRNPVQSAYSMDIEQFTYIPGIWDEVFISFTGPVRIARSLCLPSIKDKQVSLKLLLENHDNKIKREFSLLDYDTGVTAFVREKINRNVVSDTLETHVPVKCLNRKEMELKIPIQKVKLWSPDNPFLYEVVIQVSVLGKESDSLVETFGMRDFGTKGNKFILNGKKIVLRGSNISLARFFGDPSRSNLPWNKEWVKKLLVDIPKSLRWNCFRNSIGLLPDFWYDIADEYGIMLQNEWPMWKNRGWEKQIEKEFTDWVWADGSHPSIIIWDAMNESRHEYIGNVIIPKLKELDPTRIWDAGYMNEENMKLNEMDEPHYYPFLFSQRSDREKVNWYRNNYRFGRLVYHDTKLHKAQYSSVPQLVNEYCWVWLNRDGTPALITKGETDNNDLLPKKHYFRPLNAEDNIKPKLPGLLKYFLGTNKDVNANREFQAYLLQLQTEALRSMDFVNGVMSFPYLTNDKGYTGDWFLKPIKDLIPAPALLWQFHSFSPFAVFIDEEDGRYLKNPKSFEENKMQPVRLLAVNDTDNEMKGVVNLQIINNNNEIIRNEYLIVKLAAHHKEFIAANIKMPDVAGGYLLVTELSDKDNVVQISRRFIRVGKVKEQIKFPDSKFNLQL